MSSLLSVIPIVVRRVAANARLLAAVVIGAVLAAALMSTTSIYTDAIRDLGLSYAIRQRGPDKINMQVRTNTRSSLQEGYEKDRDFIDGAARNSLGPLIKTKPVETAYSQTFFPTAPGAAVSTADTRPRSNLQFFSNLEPHVKVVEGRLPRDASPAAEGGPAPAIEAALGGATARRTGAKVGDRFDLHPFWAENVEPVHLTIVGIIDPVDAADPYFFGTTGHVRVRHVELGHVPVLRHPGDVLRRGRRLPAEHDQRHGAAVPARYGRRWTRATPSRCATTCSASGGRWTPTCSAPW